MLTQLYIKNFTLIDELNVDFHNGFSVITGETGAGKSIILGALGLLLGNRADIKAIKDGANRCIIEAHYNIENYGFKPFFDENDIDYFDDDCIIRREVNANGKSRAFINDIPVSLTVIKELGEQLIDIHSQHQNLLLQKDDFQLSVVDIIGNSNAILNSYKESYKKYHEAILKLKQTRESIEKDAAQAEYIRFQYEEMELLNLKSGEEEELEKATNTMKHSEDIKSALYETDNNFNEDGSGILPQLYKSIAALNSVVKVYPDVEDTLDRLNECYIELKDIAGDVSYSLSNVDYDPEELERLNSRLDAIYTLEQKHHVGTIDELLELQEKFRSTLNVLENSEMALEDLEKEVEKAKADAEKYATKLTALRKKAAKSIEKDISERLKPLGLPNVRFEVSITEKALSSDGADKVEFLFSANPGTPLRPVGQIASGGEIARVMLSLKAMLSGAVKLPTIIFDEIDTGVSGRVAEQMAFIMKEMGENDRQVISITHLPQIAALGKNHYKVYKEQGSDNTTSHMKELTQDERVNEIAQMLSGSNITSAAIDNAKELLGL